MAADRPQLCVSVHDVAPAALEECRATLAFLDSLAISPVALLVVPDYHGRGRADRDARFCEFLTARVRRGDEIVLHGYWHQDTHQPCRTAREWLEQRVLTASEGEFSRLDSNAARTRILRGMAVLRSAGWRPHGFVAPAWHMSAGTLDALETLPLRYCATRDYILPTGGAARIPAPSLVVSTRSRWRRTLSPLWNHAALSRRTHSPVLRAAMHPGDIRYARVETMWRRLFEQLIDRTVMTEGQIVAAT